MGQAIPLSVLFQEILQPLQAKPDSEIVRTCWATIGKPELSFLDDRGDDRELRLGYESSQVTHKVLTPRRVDQKLEGPLGLPDPPLVQDDHVVTEVFEFELLQRRNAVTQVQMLSKDAERQDEDGILPVDRIKAMVTAFIDVDDEFTKSRGVVFEVQNSKKESRVKSSGLDRLRESTARIQER